MTEADQLRIMQLTSSYSPDAPPQLRLTFGDFLSLLWRIDQASNDLDKAVYYRQCAAAVARGLGFQSRSMYRIVMAAQPGDIYKTIGHAPYRGTTRLVDAQDRRAAIRQLVDMRGNILSMGIYREQWTLGWPGSRITDTELRDRLFAVLFTAFNGQFSHFSRLLLVIDIVLLELLLDDRTDMQISLIRLIREYNYPDPDDEKVRAIFTVK